MSTDFTSRPRYESQPLPAQSLSAQPPVHGSECARPWQSEKSLRVMLAYVRGLVESIVKKQPPSGLLPPALANERVMGVAISAMRAGEPRCHALRYAISILPQQINDYSLGYLLAYLASSLAAGGEDQPRLSPHELSYLGYELTILHASRWVTQQAEARISCVQPELHGVVLDHPLGRGILLPQTSAAMELQDDASRMLDRVSTLAGLGPDAWRRDPQTRLFTFQTVQAESEPALAELGSLSLSGSRVQSLLDEIQRAAAGGSVNTQDNEDELVEKISPLLMAVGVTTASGRFVWAGGKARTLRSLATAVGQQLQQPSSSPVDPVVQLLACWRPTLLQPSDPHARRHLTLAPMLHLQSPSGCDLIPGGRMTRAQIADWQQGNLMVTALAMRTYEQRARRKPPARR